MVNKKIKNVYIYVYVVSGPAGIVGGGVNVQRSLSTHNTTLEQGTEPPTAPRVPQHKCLPTAPGVFSQCVCVHYCVCALKMG